MKRPVMRLRGKVGMVRRDCVSLSRGDGLVLGAVNAPLTAAQYSRIRLAQIRGEHVRITITIEGRKP